MWAGEVEDVDKPQIWDAIKWPSGDQMRHLKTFIFSEGRKYRQLEPHVELLSPNKSDVPDFSGWDGCVGWAYCSRTPDKHLFMLYFEKGCAKATLSGALPNANYQAGWFDPRQGVWLPWQGQAPLADSQGTITLPSFPAGPATAKTDWALKLTLDRVP
jgi:hypothetical protein